MNRSFCNQCDTLVEAAPVERDGKMYLVKNCSKCGTTESLISSDSERYMMKHSLDDEHTYSGCMLKCIGCGKKKEPSFVFIDITNRCNLNCPICINNTPSMGFLFEPPLDYFEKIFDHFADCEERPTIQLFGGEPTMRDDLFDIIRAAKERKLTVRIVTNGIKLADEDYCQQIVNTNSTVLMAYDGSNPKTYEVLRGSTRMLEMKQKAVTNLKKLNAKVAFMTCVARGYNDKELNEIIEYAHEARGVVRGIYFLPLALAWDPKEMDLEADRINTEDIEIMLDNAFPDERIDFMPAGIMGGFPTLCKYLGVKRVPFMGAHPNCESFYVLFSDGERYRPLSWCLKAPVQKLGQDIFAFEAKLAQSAARFGENPSKIQHARMMGKIGIGLMGIMRKNVRIDRIIKGRGVANLWHLLCILCALTSRARRKKIGKNHLAMYEALQLIILPFEDNSVLETERLERCPNSFAFYNPETEQVDHVPTCAWGQHKTDTMRHIADYYEKQSEGKESPA